MHCWNEQIPYNNKIIWLDGAKISVLFLCHTEQSQGGANVY